MIFLVRLSDRALRDLQSIFEAIHAESSAQARKWFDGLEGSIFSLDRHPDRGTVTRESDSHRQLLYGRKPNVYRIIYQVDRVRDAVNIVHIRHGAMSDFEV